MVRYRNILFGLSLLAAGVWAGTVLQSAHQASSAASGFEPRLPPAASTDQPRDLRASAPVGPSAAFDSMLDYVGVGVLGLFIVGSVALAVRLARRRQTPRSAVAGQSAAAIVLGDSPANANEAGRDVLEYQKVPRELAHNPFGAEGAHLSFDERVRIAALGSVQAGRVIGAIQFKLTPTLEPGDEEARPDLSPVAHIAERFARNLRRSDGVRVMGPDEIVIFVSLLARRRELEDISFRLRRVLVKEGMGDQILHNGIAMYPIDGYTCAEMIEAARAHPGLLPPTTAANAPAIGVSSAQAIGLQG
jgi:hypothetical protein